MRLQLIGFGGFEELEKVSLTDGITGIPRGTFEECSNLSSLFLPGSLTEMYDTFFRCSNLNSIIFDGTMDEWYDIQKNYIYVNIDVICTDGTIHIEPK